MKRFTRILTLSMLLSSAAAGTACATLLSADLLNSTPFHLDLIDELNDRHPVGGDTREAPSEDPTGYLSGVIAVGSRNDKPAAGSSGNDARPVISDRCGIYGLASSPLAVQTTTQRNI